MPLPVFACPTLTASNLEDYSLDSRWLIGGAAGGFVQSIICTPSELVKIRQQLQIERGSAQSTLECTRQIVRKEGWGRAGLYRGFWATAFRDSPSFALYFWVNEVTTRLITESEANCPAAIWPH